MSTELKSKTESVSLTRFWGGLSKGVSIQLTQRAEDTTPSPLDHIFQNIQLTRTEAALLATDLLNFAQGKEIEQHDH